MPSLRNFPACWASLKNSRCLRRSLLVLAGVLLLGWLGMPPLLRAVIEKQGSQALGRPMSVERVSFNPLRLSARLEGLRILEADGRSEFFSLAALQLNLSSSSLWQGGLVLDALRLEKPVLNLVRHDAQRFNFSDILSRLAQPEAEPAGDASAPLRFSLNNIELSDGRIDFDDQPQGRRHAVTELNLGLPFISNHAARVETFVQPHLALRLNGSPFELLGELKPFADHREARLDLTIEALDLTPYLAYLPLQLPLRIDSARLDSALRLSWVEAREAQPASLGLSGRLGLSAVKLKDGKGGDLLALERLELDIERLEPLAAPFALHLRRVQIDAPQLELLRRPDGQLDLLTLLGTPAPVAAPKPAAAAPKIVIDQLVLNKGRLHWRDQSVAGAYDFRLDALDLQLDKLDLAAAQAARLKLQAAGEGGVKLEAEAALGFKSGRHEGRFALSGVQLESLRPYYAAALARAQLRGEAAVSGDFRLAPGSQDNLPAFDKLTLELKQFSLAPLGSKSPVLNLPLTRVEALSLDPAQRSLRIGRVSSQDGRLRLLRDKNGELDLLALLQAPASSSGKPSAAPQREAAKSGSGKADEDWQIAVDQAQLSGLGLRFEDRTGSAPVLLEISGLAGSLREWSNRRGAQAQLELAARVNRKGSLELAGKLASDPLKGQLRLDLRSVDILAVQPYVEAQYRVLVTRGAVSAKGVLNFDLSAADAPQFRYAGSLAVEDFNALDRVNDSDFMRWKRFSIQDAVAQTRPPLFASKEVRLQDFYTRLILDEQGRLNVRELTAGEQEDVASAPASAASAPVAAPVASGGAGAAPPQIDVQRIVLEGGHVNFVDRFVKPSYEANLLALGGSLEGLSSASDALARLQLKASMDGAAPVNVSGSLNPFREDGFLDIQAQVRDVDLTAASTYAGRYVGYGIDKGKLSMDVQYEIRKRQLSARNRLKLDQLSFGNKVESPDATSLPVLLAVSLLKDRHGLIDLNLPISGSLDDPQFSVGRVILKVIGNLLSKALTSPFALLGSMFGGDAEALSYLDFAAGSAQIGSAGEQKLGELGKALLDRPALKLEVSGRADPAADSTGLKRARLETRLRALKAAQLVKRGEAVAQVDRLTIQAEEYPALLKAAYESEKLDARPRNALGLLRTQPVEAMEKILLASYLVTPEDLQALAAQRAQAVRAHLVDKAGVEAGRIFLLGTANALESAEGKPAQARVEFSLR